MSINRMNEKGMKLLEYKKELMKNYPPIVQDSLLLSLEQLAEAEVIDGNTLFIMRDQEQDYESLKEYLEENLAFMKTEEEILVEFEVIRKAFQELLQKSGLVGLYSESVVPKDCITVSKQFVLDYEFAMSYFDVDEGDAIKLMKRRGFIEKFAVLRLMAIFKPFIEGLDFEDEDLEVEHPGVYYDKELDAYALDIVFEIPVESLTDDVESDRLCEVISSVVDKGVVLFEENFTA